MAKNVVAADLIVKARLIAVDKAAVLFKLLLKIFARVEANCPGEIRIERVYAAAAVAQLAVLQP